MSVLVVGLNHRSAPLQVLERVAVQPSEMGKCLAGLVARDTISEAVVVSTCMRTEVYVVAERFHGAVSDIAEVLGELDARADSTGPSGDLGEYLYTYYDRAAVAHLFRVASGVDSVVLGEGEVLGQVRDAWQVAASAGASGPVLNALFRHGAEVGKRARTDTAIARGVTSIPYAGTELACAALDTPLEHSSVLVVGAGTIGTTVATAVASSWRPAHLVVASRTLASADRACGAALDALGDGARTEIAALSLDGPGVWEQLGRADAVFCAVAGGAALISVDKVRRVRAQSAGRTVVIVDLGVPRNVEPAVGALDGVTLRDIDDISAYVESSVAGRVSESAAVAEIVEEEVARYCGSASARQFAPVLTRLRAKAEETRSAEVGRYSRRLAGLDERERAAVDALTKAIIAKVLHDPTVRLKDAAGSPRGERLGESLRDLFDL